MVRCWQRSSVSSARWTERTRERRGEGNGRTTTRTSTARLDVDVPRLAARSGDADADEQPRPGGCRAPRRPRRLRRHRPRGALVGRLRRDHPHAHDAGRRRDDARAIGQAGRRVPHERVGAAGVDRQLQPGAGVGQLGRVPPARGTRPDDVRADDRRLVDLHRHARDPAGHVRMLRRDRPPQVRRHARRHDHADRRPGRHGRRPAAGRHHERWRRAVHRRRRVARRAPCRDPLSR